MVSEGHTASTIETASERRDRMGLGSTAGVGPIGARSAYVTPISWGAVLAGAAIAAVSQIVLSILGLGIGLANYNPASEPGANNGFGTGAAIWGVVSMLISLGLGGFVAGYIAGSWRIANGLLHGLLVWAVAVLASVYLLTTSAASLAGGGLNAIAQGAAANAGRIADQAQNTNVVDRARAQIEANAPSEPQVRRQAERAAEGAGRAALWTFAALALGAASASLAGKLGRDRAPMAPADTHAA